MTKPPIEDRVRDCVTAERASIQPPPWFTARILHTLEAARPAPGRDPVRIVGFMAPVAAVLLIAVGIAVIRMIGAGPSPAGVVKGSWSSAPGMAVARGYHTATLLPNGKVLVVGGFDPIPGAMSSAELYDPSTRRWTSAGNLATPRFYHTATLLRTGKVLVVGGQDNFYDTMSFAFGHGQSSAELYDPRTNGWSPAASMTTVRTEHTATLLADGRVLAVGGYTPRWYDGTGKVVGGQVIASAELYDPVSNRWATVGSLGTARARHSAVLLPDHRVLVLGGVDLVYVDSNFGSALRTSSLKSAELYDPATEAWSPAPSMQFTRIHPTSTLLPNGQVLVVGDEGTDGGSAEVFDPVSSRWLPVPKPGGSRAGQVAVSLSDGNVLVAGGRGESSAQLYDWRRNGWRGAGTLMPIRVNAAGTVLGNGQVLVAGGFGPYQEPYPYQRPYKSVELYDPSGQPSTTIVPRAAAGVLSIGFWPLLGIGVVVLAIALWSFRRRLRGPQSGDEWIDFDR